MPQKPLRKKISLFVLLILIAVWAVLGIKFYRQWSLHRDVSRYITTPSLKPTLQRIKAVRFDPSFYYQGKRPSELAKELAHRWQEAGINLVFFRAYDPSYGAFYRTNYLHNKQGEFGRYDLLKHILKACAKKKIAVFAWLPVMNHRGAWEANPEWRERNAQGEAYSASGLEFPLCSRNEDARAWWKGFIQDLLQNYSELAGVDFAEPVVSWQEESACFCELCREAQENSKASQDNPENIRAQPLTTLLHQSFLQVHQFHKKASLTFVATARESGELFSWGEIKKQTGLDLDSLLSVSRSLQPDFISPEFIWQEWKSRFDKESGESPVFSPKWAAWAYKEFIQNLNYPVKVVPHLEATDFPDVSVSRQHLAASLRETLKAGASGFDVYSSSLLDKKRAWGILKEVDRWVKVKSCLVLYDPGSNQNDAIQTGELLRHFHAQVELKSLEQYQPGLINQYDNVFYAGTEQETLIPRELIEDIENLQTTFCWLGFNVKQLLSEPQISQKLGIQFIESVKDGFVKVKYKNQVLTKDAPWTQLVKVTDPLRCQVMAFTYDKDQSEEFPYALRSGRRFWLFADLPSSYAVEGGRFLVFADLLHDILEEDHVSQTLAMVRIEDVHPLSDPQNLKKIANFLYRRKVPFQVAFTPFYVNPEENLHTSLSEQPALVSALRHMVRKGGVLVLHGVTHQRYSETTTDYEFWDPVNDAPVQGQTPTTMQQRVEWGLRECWLNGLYPLLWETPHYAASQDFYSVISQIFSTAMERRQAIDRIGTDQYLPYTLSSDRYNQTMVPENLGYVPLNNPDPQVILKPAAHMKVVRDGVASFFFHPFVDVEVLKTLVRRLQKEGFVFTNPASLPLKVKTSLGLLQNSSGSVTVSPPYSLGWEKLLFSPGILKKQKEFTAFPGEKIEKRVSLSPKELYALHFLNPVEETVREAQKRPDLKKPAPIHALKKVADYQGEEAEVPTALLLHPAEAEDHQQNERMSYESVLQSVGISVSLLPVSEFERLPEKINLLVIPEASALGLQDAQIQVLIDLLEQGQISVITSGYSPLSDALGIEKTEQMIQVKKPQDLSYPDLEIIWPESVEFQVFEAPGEAEYIYQDSQTRKPLMVSVPRGKGKFLYSGLLFDTESTQGITRYPHFLTHMFRTLEVFPLLRGRGTEVFFNPAEREEIAVEDLVRFWKRSGVTLIHAASWHIYPEWTYDYEQLIHLAHNNSMLVYAWLEPPLVHQIFWQDNPEWREKNAQGETPEETWRFPIALGDCSARKGALKEWKRILEEYQWDGVTVNRLGFESTFPPDPKTMTPFHPSVRQQFKEQKGFDPVELFNQSSPYFWETNPSALNQYLDFRRALSEEYLESLLLMLQELREQQKRTIELILTYDARRKDPGISFSKLQKIKSSHQALWQYIPEFEKQWTAPPLGFDLIQLNVSPPNHDSFIPGVTTFYPTGSALYKELQDLLHDNQRFIIYSENSLYEVDTQMMPFVLSAESSLRWRRDQLQIQSKTGGEFSLAGEKTLPLYLDGKLAGSFYKNRLIVPSGKHVLEIRSGPTGLLKPLKSSTRVVDFSGKLNKIEVKWRGISVDYEAERGSFLVITDKPSIILLNGKKQDLFIEEGPRGWTLYLPPGRATAEVITRSHSEFILSVFSLGLSNLIVLISALAIFTLLILFLILQMRRIIQRKKT